MFVEVRAESPPRRFFERGKGLGVEQSIDSHTPPARDDVLVADTALDPSAPRVFVRRLLTVAVAERWITPLAVIRRSRFGDRRTLNAVSQNDEYDRTGICANDAVDKRDNVGYRGNLESRSRGHDVLRGRSTPEAAARYPDGHKTPRHDTTLKNVRN